MKSILIFPLLFLLTISTYPIALFHGLTGSCTSNKSKEIKRLLEKYLKTKVHCVEIGNGRMDSIFMNLEKQSQIACANIKKIKDFEGKFNIMGVSQGTLIGRYIIEKCNMKGKVQNYVSFMGPQMGIGYIPKLSCGKFCDIFNNLVADLNKKNPKLLAEKIAPASYWKYRYQYDQYMKDNVYLKDLNNEGPEKNQNYKNRIMNLNKMLLVKGSLDTIISPRESSWFEFYDKKGEKIVPLKQSDFYINDYLGIKALDQKNKLKFVTFNQKHVKYSEKEFATHIIGFLKDDGDVKK